MDAQKVDAVIRCFEVIGEAAKRIDDATLSQIGGVDWRGFKGFRDVLIHEYDEIDLSLVWKSVTEEVPGLVAAVREFLAKNAP